MSSITCPVAAYYYWPKTKERDGKTADRWRSRENLDPSSRAKSTTYIYLHHINNVHRYECFECLLPSFFHELFTISHRYPSHSPY